jgi:hypothetical protein
MMKFPTYGKSLIAMEIVDLPIKNGGFVHNFLYVPNNQPAFFGTPGFLYLRVYNYDDLQESQLRHGFSH